MKKVITAIGNEELNNILKVQRDIIVENPDIQYQEGIIEALDKYRDIDMVILYENIIGELELEDLIRSITIIKNDIEIILITDEEVKLESKQIVKIVKNNENYIRNILEYLLKEEYIIYQNANLNEFQQADNTIQNKDNSNENITLENRNKRKDIISSTNRNISKSFKGIEKKDKQKNVITVIGHSGSRKNKLYINTIQNRKNKKDISYRF